MFGQWFARRRRPTDAEIARELRDHLELEAQERGGDDGPAAAAARRRFGNLTRAGEDVRAVWRSAWWDQFGTDTRIALRTLRRSKAFATFSILALALAITANTTMSSLIDAIVFPRVAFPHPERLVIARFHGSPWYVTAPGNTSPPTATMAAVLGSSGGTYSAATTWPGDDDRTYDIAIQARDQHLHIAAAAAGPGFFATVGARPLYGTLYHDSTAATRHEAVISEGLWRRISGDQTTFAPFELSALYAGGTDALTVIGVLPHNGAPPLDADLYLPQTSWSSDAALIRLRPGATHAQLLTELNALAPRIDRNHSRVARFELEPAIVSPAKHLDLVAALAASTLAVLLIACANIANLLVARGMARSRELATRMALGASRLRVARLLFAESGIVALTGGVLGVLLALWTIHVLGATLPANLQYLGLVQPQLSWRVVAAGMGLTVVAAVVFGVAPVIGMMRADVGTILTGASGRH
ncbi:MAG: FtsX-like permease family protein, partial [Gemmatimonadaceae bacterium]